MCKSVIVCRRPQGSPLRCGGEWSNIVFLQCGTQVGFSELDRIAKDAATMADENQLLLGGEHYLTDRELSQRLKISRRTLQDYRNNGILPYRQLGGKILYRESDIERVLQK